MMEAERTWGGSRRGAGRAVRNIHLDAETARTLRLLKLHHAGDVDEHQLVANLIKQAWDELDDAYQAAAKDQDE